LAYSHIKLTGGAADGKSVQNTISQTAHGFTAGMAIRYNNASATGITGDKYMAAIATSAEESEVVGVISEISGPSTFVLTYAGEVASDAFGSDFAIGDNDVFFLSGTTAGLLTPTPPSSAGQVIKPVVVKTSDDKAIVTNYVGTIIGGSSTVSLDTVQPVGTIQPFAGAVTDIPNTWSLCDGNGLPISTYPELYTRLGRSYGFYLKVTLSQNWGGSAFDGSNTVTRVTPQVGQYVYHGENYRYSGVIVEVGSNYYVADMDYLDIDTYNGGFVPQGTYSDQTEIDYENTNVSIYLNGSGNDPTTPSTNLKSFGSGTPITVGQTDPTGVAHGSQDRISDTDSTDITYTTEVTHVRVPDLRGKVVLGETTNGKGTVIPADRDFIRGQIGGAYDLIPLQVSAGAGDWSGTEPTDAIEADNLQPYVGMNWIIKNTPRSQAAFLDNLTAQIPLVDLTDVDATGMTAGEILVYDSNLNAADKFRPVLLYKGGFPETASEKNALQVQVDGTNKPRISIGSGVDSTDGVQVKLDGIYNDNFAVYHLSSDSTPTFEVKKDGVGIGTGAQPIVNDSASGVDLAIGSGGFKFANPASNRVTFFRDSVRVTDTSDNHLVSEKAVRDAIGASPTVGKYGQSCVDAKSTASFFYNSASGGSKIQATENRRWYYQSGKPIMVVVTSGGRAGSDVLQAMYYPPNSSTNFVCAIYQETLNRQLSFSHSWPMVEGSSVNIPSGFDVQSVTVFKQE